MTALVVALAVSVLLLSVLVAGLLRSHAEILKALHELGAGLELDREAGPAPVTIEGVHRPRTGSGAVPDAISGEALDGESVAVSLTSGTPTLLAFLSSGCTTCQSFWDAFAEPGLVVPGGARLVVVSRSLAEESGSALARRAPRDLPLVASSQAWESFQVQGSPYFVLLDGAARVVGEGSAATWPAVAILMGQAQADGRRRPSREQRDEIALAAAGITAGDVSLGPS